MVQISIQSLKDEFTYFSTCVMARPNAFNFASAIYYTDNTPNVLFQCLIVAISLTLLSIFTTTQVVVFTLMALIVGYRMRGGCTNCAEIQGLGLIFLTLGTIVGKHGLFASLAVSIIYFIPFAGWYYLAHRVYGKNHKKPI